MNARFGVKDFFVFALLLAVLVSVWLGVKARDRQWTLLQSIDDRLAENNRTLTQLNRTLSSGVRPVAAATNGTAAATASHPRIDAAHAFPDFAEGDWFIDVFAQTVGKLTPHVSTDVYQNVVASYVVETLADRDPDTLEWAPSLAESWTISDDGLTIRFELNPAARFSDGTPVTAADVVYSYELLMNPKIDAPRIRVYYSKVASVVADGDHAVVFTLSEPYFLGFNICAGLEILPKHYYEQFSESEFNETPGLLMGSGPYRLDGDPASWTPGTGKIELVRNDNFWGPAPALDRVVFREISDGTARLAAFRNQEIDRFGVEAAQYLTLKDDEQLLDQSNLYEYESLTGGYRYIGWNQVRDGEPSIFADVRVRRALTMLADRQEMAERLEAGLATVASGPFHPLGDQADPSIEPWPYDPDAANALLKEAGWEDRDGNGVIEDADGREMKFKLVYPASSNTYQQMVFYLKDAYARAGIVMDPDPLEWTIMLQRIDSRDFDAITLGWGGTIESDPMQIFHSDSIEGGGDNYVSYRSDEADRLITEARVTVDEQARMALWQKLHRVLHDDQPYTFLFNRKAVVFVDQRFSNVQVTKTGLNRAEEWFVPGDLQRYRD